MALEEIERIKTLFTQLHISAQYLEHEPVITSEDASRTRGFALKQGIKAIVCTNGKEYAVIDVPADQKVDMKKVLFVTSWAKKDLRMATPEEVLKVTGCEVGAVPPIGHRQPIPIFFDRTIFENTTSAFNIGLRTHSAIVKTNDMRKVFTYVDAREGDFIKEKV